MRNKNAWISELHGPSYIVAATLNDCVPLGEVISLHKSFLFFSYKPRIPILIQSVPGLWGRRWIAQAAQGPSAISEVEWHAGTRTDARLMMSWESRWPGLRSGMDSELGEP